MAEGDKPYRLYRGGRTKGKVPLQRQRRPATQPPERAGERRSAGVAGGSGPRSASSASLVLAVLWGVLGFRSFSSGVDEANERLPRKAKAQLAKRDRSLLSEPTTVLVIGTDGGRGRGARADAQPLGLAAAAPPRPGHTPDLVPLDPARPSRGDPRLRVVEDQRGEPVRRPGADARHGARRSPGLPIDHVVVVDFDGFKELIDALGGIESTSRSRSSRTASTARTSPSAAQTGRAGGSRRGRSTWTAGARSSTRASATNQLDPSDSDITRGNRQQIVADAVGDKIASFGTFLRLPFMGDSLAAPLATDLSAWELATARLGSLPRRLGRSLHCRLGGEPSDARRRVGPPRLGGQRLGDLDVARPLGARSPPPKGTLYGAGCTEALARRSDAGFGFESVAGLLGGLSVRLLGRRRRLALLAPSSSGDAVVGRVEARALEVHGHREEQLLDRAGAARRARLGRRRRSSSGRARTCARSGNGTRRSARGGKASALRAAERPGPVRARARGARGSTARSRTRRARAAGRAGAAPVDDGSTAAIGGRRADEPAEEESAELPAVARRRPRSDLTIPSDARLHPRRSHARRRRPPRRPESRADGDTDAEIRVGPGGQAANVAAWAAELGAARALRRQDGRRRRRQRSPATRLAALRRRDRRPDRRAATGSICSLVVAGRRALDGRRTAATARELRSRRARPGLARRLRPPPRLRLRAHGRARARARRCAPPSSRAADGARVSVDLVVLERDSRQRRRGIPRRGSRARARRRVRERGRGARRRPAARRRGLDPQARRARLLVRRRRARGAPGRRVVDSTGAGDALAAGWIVGGPDLALEAAARCVRQLGAMPIAVHRRERAHRSVSEPRSARRARRGRAGRRARDDARRARLSRSRRRRGRARDASSAVREAGADRPRRSACSTAGSASGSRRTSSRASRRRAQGRPARPRSVRGRRRRRRDHRRRAPRRRASGRHPLPRDGRDRRRPPRVPNAARRLRRPPRARDLARPRRVLRREVAPRHPGDDGAPRDARRPRARVPHGHAAALLLGRPAGRPCRSASTTSTTAARDRRRALAARRLRAAAREPAAREHRRRRPHRGGASPTRAAQRRVGPGGHAVRARVPARALGRSHARGQPRARGRQRAARRRGVGSVRRACEPVRRRPRAAARASRATSSSASSCRHGPSSCARRRSSTSREAARRASARTSRTTARSTTGYRSAGPTCRSRARGRCTRSRSTSRRCRSSTPSPRSTRTTTTAGGRSRARRSTSRSVRPGSHSATALGRSARPVDVRRLDGLGDPPSTERVPRLARALPRPSLQARREPSLDGRARRRARGHGRHRLDRLQGPVPRHRRRHPARRSALPPRRRGAARRLARGSRRSPTRRRRCSSRTATA